MKEKNFISAVVYVHNNEDKIQDFLRIIYEKLQEQFEKFEIICVDDASSDNSRACIQKVAEEFTNTTITILDMSYYHGLELSMNAGVDLSIGDFVYEFDNVRMDFSADVIMEIYEKSLSGYDIVSARANRKEKGTSRLFYWAFNHFSFYEYQMHTESFRILSRRAINRVSATNRTIPYRKAVYANCGLKNGEIQYQVQETYAAKREKKQGTYRKNLAADALILFTDAGYHLAMGMTILMMLAAIFVAIYTVVIYLLGNPVAGWTTTMLFLAFAFFGLFAILTIIIRYLSVLVGLNFKRKQYQFSGIEKITK